MERLKLWELAMQPVSRFFCADYEYRFTKKAG